MLEASPWAAVWTLRGLSEESSRQTVRPAFFPLRGQPHVWLDLGALVTLSAELNLKVPEDLFVSHRPEMCQ